MLPERYVPEQGPRNSSLKELDCTPAVSCSLEHHASDNTFWLVTNLNFESGGERPPTSLLPNLTRRLASRRLFRVSPCREGTIHLQKSMISPGFEPRS
ncbi:hypothetical protein TNCV_3295031 [Trichonephila clavipes]|uniref:Uncharacterized protein n=1 Tax=Trichonephila clavipes TaxID=2585209 RepID=A0A8X6VPM1_TRICX|nr:hypothetical protein TNCV_3295031 [Trichonephila clavipes]